MKLEADGGKQAAIRTVLNTRPQVSRVLVGYRLLLYFEGHKCSRNALRHAAQKHLNADEGKNGDVYDLPCQEAFARFCASVIAVGSSSFVLGKFLA